MVGAALLASTAVIVFAFLIVGILFRKFRGLERALFALGFLGVLITGIRLSTTPSEDQLMNEGFSRPDGLFIGAAVTSALMLLLAGIAIRVTTKICRMRP